jgi:hypothetical protein
VFLYVVIFYLSLVAIASLKKQFPTAYNQNPATNGHFRLPPSAFRLPPSAFRLNKLPRPESLPHLVGDCGGLAVPDHLIPVGFRGKNPFHLSG